MIPYSFFYSLLRNYWHIATTATNLVNSLLRNVKAAEISEFEVALLCQLGVIVV